MRKLFLFLIYILIISGITSFAGIDTVTSNDISNPPDNDNNYHPGQKIVIKVKTDTDYTTGEIEIYSISANTGVTRTGLTNDFTNIYTYEEWDTSTFPQANDYKVRLWFDGESFEDVLTIKLDSEKPYCSSITLTNSLNNTNIVRNSATETVSIKAIITDSSYDSVNNITKANIKADLSDFGKGLTPITCSNYDSFTGEAIWSNIIVAGMSEDGTIDISATTDSAGNTLDLLGVTSQVVTYDGTAPELKSKELINSSELIDYTNGNETITLVLGITEPNMDLVDITADFSALGAGASVNPDLFDGTYATWEVDISTNGNGNRTIPFSATDNAGNELNGSHTVVLDTIRPEISNLVIATENNGYVRDGETVTVTCDYVETNLDLSLIKADLSQLGGAASVSPVLDSGKLKWTFTSDLSAVIDGVQTISILPTSTDEAGNTVVAASGHSLNATIISDKTAPAAISITLVNSSGVQNNARKDDEVDIVVEISDANGLTASDIILDLSQIGIAGDITLDTYSAGFGTAENIVVGDVTEGDKTISIKATTVDKAGNSVSGTTTETVKIDRTAPEVLALTATGSNGTTGLAMSSDTVKVVADISGEGNIDPSYIRLNASSLGLDSSIIPTAYTDMQGATWEITYTDISTSGNYPLTISGIDRAGNELFGTLEVQLEIDKDAPSVTSVTLKNSSGIESAYVNGANITATVYISDTEENLLKEDITADITDFKGAGNEAVEPNTYTGGIATWNITVTEAALEGTKTFSVNATVKDKAGNIVTGTLQDTIKEDNTAPDLTSVNIADGGYAKPGTVEISVFLTEAETLSSREVTLNYKVDAGALQTEQMILSNGSSPFNYKKSVNITGTSFTYWITGKDNAGNDITGSLVPAGIAEGSAINVTLDNGNPAFDVSGTSRAEDNTQSDSFVKAGDSIKILVNVADTVTAAADLVVKADLSVFDSSFGSDVTIPYSTAGDTFEIVTDPLNSQTLNQGVIPLVISAEDEVGNITTHEVSITIDNTTPVVSSKNIYSEADRDIYFKEGDTGEIVFDMGETGLSITGEVSTFDAALTDSAFTDNTDGTYTLFFDELTATMAEGTIEIDINIEDKAGNSLTEKISAVLDRTPVNFASGTIEVTDEDNWYKAGDRINLRVILPKEERLTSLYCDLSPLGGNLSAQTEVPFILSFYSDTGAVFTLISDELGTGINEILGQNLTITAVDKAGNSQTDSSIIINTDRTLPEVNTIVEFRDRFNNLLKSAESTFPCEVYDTYYESIDELHSNITRVTLEIEITEANCEADLSTFNIKSVVPGKGEKTLNIKDAVDATDASVSVLGNVYTVTFTDIDVSIPGMENGDSFEIYVTGNDSAENIIEEKIISSTLREYALVPAGFTASVSPSNINPQGKTMLEFLVSGIDLKAYNNGFDSIKIIFDNEKYNAAYIDNASIDIANPLNPLDIVPSVPVGGQCNATVTDNEILFYFPQDIQEHLAEGSLNTAFKIKLEVDPVRSDNEPSYFTVKVLNSTLAREQTLTDSLQVYINSPVSSISSEIWPSTAVPGGWFDMQVFIKPGIGVQDTGYDRIIVNHIFDDGDIETGTYTANIMDNGDSFEIYAGTQLLSVDDDGDGNPESIDEVSIMKEVGRDTFEVIFFERKTTDELITLKYKAKAPTTLGQTAKIEVTLKDSGTGLSATDITGGDAISEYINNKLDLTTKNMAGLVKAEVNPGRFIIDDQTEMDITIEPTLTTDNSGLNYFYLEVPNLNFDDTSEISNVTLKLSTFTMTTVTDKIPGDSEVLMNINDNNGTAEIELIAGRKLNSSSFDKHVYINLKGNIGTQQSDNTITVKVGDNVNYSKITASSANADVVINNDSLNYRTGNIYNDFTRVSIAPDKISSGGSSQFVVKVNPDFQNAMKDIDADTFFVEFPLQIFNMSDSVAIRNTVSVERILFNGGTPSSTSYSEIYSGTPALHEALVSVAGNTLEVKIGDLLHKKVSPDTEGTLEITLSLSALDIEETSADIKVFAANSSSDKKMEVSAGASGNRTVTVKRANMNATGKIEDPDRIISGPAYIEKSQIAQRLKYTSNITVQAISEPMNVLYFDFPDIFTGADSSSVTQVTLQTVGIPVDITADCTVTDNDDNHDIKILMNTAQIASGTSGTVEVIFTLDNPDVNSFPEGNIIYCYIDNKDFSLPVSCQDNSFNSTKVYITETAQAIGGEINPSYTKTDTYENVIITIVPTINSGQFGVDSFEIRLPQGINYNSNMSLTVNGVNRIESTHYESSVYDIDLGASGTKEVITIGLFNKLSDRDVVKLSFTAYSNNKVYAVQHAVEITALSTELGFSDMTVADADVDGQNNNNTLNFVSEAKPGSITAVTLTPDEMVVNEEIDCTMAFSFDFDNIIHEGIDRIVIDLPTGMTPSDIGNTVLTIDTIPVAHTTVNELNDIVLMLTSTYNTNGSHNAVIDFSVNTPSSSMLTYISLFMSNNNSHFNEILSDSLKNTECAVNIRKEVKNIGGTVIPNNAVASRNTDFSVFLRPEIENGDLGINRVLVNYPDGFTYVTGSEVKMWKISSDTPEIISIEAPEHNLFIPAYGDTGKTYDVAITTLQDALTMKSPTFEVSVTDIYRIDLKLQAPVLAVGQEFINGSFEIFADNIYSPKEIAVNTSQDMPEWAGNSFNVRVSETKIKEDSLNIRLSAGNSGTYRLELSCQFTSVMNNSVEPFVEISGQTERIPLKKTDYSGNRYSGYALIPVSIISDFATSVDIEFDTDTFKDIYNTPLSQDKIEDAQVNPAFLISDFQYPLSKVKMLVLIKASEIIKNDISLKITQENSLPKNIELEKIDNTIYKGIYDVDPTRTGQAYIEVTGTENNGVLTGRDIKTFNVLRGGLAPARIEFSDFSLVSEAPVLKDESVIISEFFNENDKALRSPSKSEESALEYSNTGVNIWPERNFINPLKIESIKTKGAVLLREEKDGFRFYDTLEKGIRNSGKYVVAYDNNAPVIEKKSDSKYSINDKETGIKSVEFEFDGMTTKRNLGGSYEYLLDIDRELIFLTEKEYDIDIEITDRAGNRTPLNIKYVPTSLGSLNVVAYPNPASDFVIFKADGLLTASKALLKIYDVSGKIIYRQNISGISEFYWDTVDRTGNKAANGLYYYKVETESYEYNGKIAIIR